MVQGNYERILDKIAKSSGLEKEEVSRRVEAKRAKLSDLISYEGAAQIVAAELGINFEEGTLKIEELLPGMRKINVVGKIISLSPVRTFKTKKGDDGKVVNFMLADETSNIKVVLWDTNHISLIENGSLGENSVVELINASMRDNEIHLGSFSELKPSSEVLENVKTEKIISQKNISDFVLADNVQTRAFVVQSFEPRFFHVCPECKKKATTDGETYVCVEHGKVLPEKRALINIVLDDGSGTIRAVLFHDNIGGLGITEFDNPEKLSLQREDLLGKEFMFSGNVRRNSYFNNEEFIVENVLPIDLDGLISSLEK